MRSICLGFFFFFFMNLMKLAFSPYYTYIMLNIPVMSPYRRSSFSTVVGSNFVAALISSDICGTIGKMIVRSGTSRMLIPATWKTDLHAQIVSRLARWGNCYRGLGWRCLWWWEKYDWKITKNSGRHLQRNISFVQLKDWLFHQFFFFFFTKIFLSV